MWYAVIPSSLVSQGTLRYRVEGTGLKTQWYEVTVSEGLPYTDGEGTAGDFSILVSSTLERWFYDVGTFRTTLPNGQSISSVYSSLRSPYRQKTSDGPPKQYNTSVDVWPGIDSPHNTRRSATLSNPHRGIDLDIRNYEHVYAMLPVAQIYRDGSYPYVRTKHDLNGDGQYDMYIRYEHCIAPTDLHVDQDVGYSTLMGTIRYNENHLHLKFEAYESGAHLSMSLREFFKNRSEYASGADVDFIKEPIISSDGSFQVDVYGFSAPTTYTYASEVKVYHRQWGTSTWSVSALTKQTNNRTWTFNLKSAGGYSNCYVEFYVAAKRSGYDTLIAYRPCYYNIYTGPTNTPPAEWFIVRFN